ncbi:bifunctional oligoribonuclease/PAP phosphatase NrnA [Acidobacteria bacterium AH-259-A15]|nr:bifunctional oligoribonuclease/PAP phosphatase NrnA [Acidobacteria bacterium AH-259-A15]
MEEIIRFIQSQERFAVTSHARPDGDSIGSELGLAFALEELGKTVHVFNADPHPRPYNSLPGIHKIRVTDRVEGNYDGLFVLECNDLKRPEVKGLDEYFVINIDHHPKTKPFGDLNWVDPSAAAVGEMIYHLVKALQVPLTPEITVNLYTAILTDTGSFQYSNTGAGTFLVVSDLVNNGADPNAIAQSVYMTQPYSRIQLLGTLLNTLELHPSKKIALITLTQEMLQRTGASANDTEGLVNYALSIQGVLLAAFFREEAKNQYRVSLRSKDHYDVGSVAEHFGGGGHKNAAGLLVQGSFKEARDKVVSELEKLLD